MHAIYRPNAENADTARDDGYSSLCPSRAESVTCDDKVRHEEGVIKVRNGESRRLAEESSRQADWRNASTRPSSERMTQDGGGHLLSRRRKLRRDTVSL